MFFRPVLAVFLSFLLISVAEPQTVVKKVLRQGANDTVNLAVTEKAAAYEKGFTKEGNEFICNNGENPDTASGIVFVIPLHQTAAAPIRAEGWSKAENVNSSPSSDYGLYIDITYTDDTHLWGITTPFSTGTHDWERKNLFLMPEKPVKTVYFYALFRNKSGKVRFRDIKLSAATADPSVAVFDGIPVQVQPAASSKKLSCQLRDVAANSDFLQLEENTLGIKSRIVTEPLPNGFGQSIEITLENPDGNDRCLSLVVARQCSELTDKQFCRVRKTVPVKGAMFEAFAQYQIGSSGRLSKYPFAAVTGKNEIGKQRGVGLGIDLAYPAFFRLGYNEQTDELFAVADVALTKESPKAVLNFVNYRFTGKYGFRGAVARYYQIFPRFFRCRTPEQGIWMPFAAISKVPQFEDFGFKFKEGDDETAWDDVHHIITFRYTEPMTWWMPMPKETPRTYEAALDIVNKEAEKGNVNAKALLNCGMKTADGKFAHQFQDTPWCVGVVWSFCDVPGISNGGYSVKWNKDLANKLYGKKDGLDGEYIDSSEGYVTAVLDFDRSHFSAVRCPLVFSSGDYKPTIFRGLVAYEYARGLSEDVHRRDKVMMANSTPDSLCWLAPYIDVMGTETNWNGNNHWQPMDDENLMFRRILCGPKPYCFLMNTDFTKWSYESTEKFMKRSLAYGMFPGFFSADAATGHYFANPELYERDRPLFKKYIPVCKEVAEAGWQPVSGAVSSTEKVYVERFGSDPKQFLFTVFNDSENTQEVEIRFDETAFSSPLPVKWKNRLDGTTVEVKENTVKISLDAQDVAVLIPAL